MSGREHAGRSPSEVGGLEPAGVELLCAPGGFGAQPGNEARQVCFTRGMLVKGAVGADPVAEGNMDVEVYFGSL